MELDAALWSGLPSEMVERVLSFLPVPDLCRHRSVAKKWNRLICNPRFGAAHAQNAGKQDASYVVMRLTDEGWGFLNLDARPRRWFTVRDDRLKKSSYWRRSLVEAMDGGLVCQYVRKRDFLSPIVIVFNPLGKAKGQLAKELPAAPSQVANQRTPKNLHLVVDSISQQFKVFHIIGHISLSLVSDLVSSEEDQILTDSLLLVYNSSTNEWRRTTLTYPFFCDVSPYEHVSNIVSVKTISSVVFQGLLYAILACIVREPSTINCRQSFELWRYNALEDAWEKVNVEVPIERPCLFASANRLSIIGWVDADSSSCRLQVFEINIPRMETELLFEVPQAVVMDFFGVPVDEDNYPEINIASGFGDSLLFSCKSAGELMVLDLETRLWDRLPGVPAGTLQHHLSQRISKPVPCALGTCTLMLPSTLWWQGGQLGGAHQDLDAT